MASSSLGRLVVVGQGYVGLPLALRAAEVGYEVVGFDLDGSRIKRLEAGESPIEDISDARLQAALDAGTLPAHRRPGCAGRLRRGRHLGPHPAHRGQPRPVPHHRGRRRCWRAVLSPGATVVLESTTYPGTTEELVRPAARGRARA